MSDVKVFEVAVEEAGETESGELVTKPFQFAGDERIYHARRPKSLSMIKLQVDGAKGELSAVTAFEDFFGGPPDAGGLRHGGVVTVDDWQHIHGRLVDPLDRLDLPQLLDVYRWILGEFSGNRGGSSSD